MRSRMRRLHPLCIRVRCLTPSGVSPTGEAFFFDGAGSEVNECVEHISIEDHVWQCLGTMPQKRELPWPLREKIFNLTNYALRTVTVVLSQHICSQYFTFK